MENRINVNQPGGMIQIDIKEDGTIFMTGTVGYIAEMSVAESFFSQKENMVYGASKRPCLCSKTAVLKRICDRQRAQNADMAEKINKNEI